MAKKAEKTVIRNGVQYYYDRITIGKDTKGKLIRKFIYAKTVTELKEKRKELLKQIDEGVKVNTKITFEAFFKTWLFSVHFINKKLSTQERYEGLYRNYIKNSLVSNIDIKKINSLKIQEFYNSLIYDKNKTPSTIKMLNKLIKPCLTYAYNQGLTTRDFGKGLKVPKINSDKKATVNAFTLDEQKRFLLTLRDNKERAIYITALGTGLRMGELLALRWANIDFENSTITIEKTFKTITTVTENGRGKTITIEQEPKTKNSKRTVPIPKNVLSELEEHKSKQDILKNKFKEVFQNNNLVFCTNLGTIIDESNLRRRYKTIIKNSKIENKKFHDLRHTYATRLFEQDVPLKTIQILLGHSDIQITANTYLHVMNDEKLKAIEKINNIFDLEE